MADHFFWFNMFTFKITAMATFWLGMCPCNFECATAQTFIVNDSQCTDCLIYVKWEGIVFIVVHYEDVLQREVTWTENVAIT